MYLEGLKIWFLLMINLENNFFRNIEYHIFGVFLQQTVLISVGFLTFLFEVTNFTVR